MGWPPDKPIKPKKRNNPGKASLPRIPESKQRLKHFVEKVFDKDKPLIKKKEERPTPTTVEKELSIDPVPKIKKEKEPKEPKDKTKYKWEKNYHTDKSKEIGGNPNPDYNITRQSGKTKGPGYKEEGTRKWKISSWGKDKANFHQPSYPGTRTKKVTTTTNEEKEWEQYSVTKYKRSHSGYTNLYKKDAEGNAIQETYQSFPSRKELKAFNKEIKAEGKEPIRAIRKSKSYNDLWDVGTMKQKKNLPPGKDSYVKTYYRGKLKPKITYY